MPPTPRAARASLPPTPLTLLGQPPRALRLLPKLHAPRVLESAQQPIGELRQVPHGCCRAGGDCRRAGARGGRGAGAGCSPAAARTDAALADGGVAPRRARPLPPSFPRPQVAPSHHHATNGRAQRRQRLGAGGGAGRGRGLRPASHTGGGACVGGGESCGRVPCRACRVPGRGGGGARAGAAATGARPVPAPSPSDPQIRAVEGEVTVKVPAALADRFNAAVVRP